MSGFIEAEGCFSIRKNNNHSFSIGQNDDIYLINAIKQSESEFGIKYTVDFDLAFNNNVARIKTAWIVENEDNIPGLITCYIKL